MTQSNVELLAQLFPNTVTEIIDEEGKMKELSFENAYIIEFAEGIDIVGTAPMSISITISAQIIKIGGAEYEENWPKA